MSATERVAAAVAALGHGPCESMTPLEGGAPPSRTYLVTWAGGVCAVAKLNRPGQSIGGSVENLRTLAALGIPVPRVLAFTRDAEGDVLLMEWLPGCDLGHVIATMSEGEMTGVAVAVMDMQRRVAALEAGSGCGFVPVGAVAQRSWSDVVRRPNRYAWADPLPNDAAPLVSRVFAAIEQASSYLEAVVPACFLDDLTTRNVMIEDGRVSGVVDFDVVCYGDPLFHIGLTGAAVTANTPPRCRFYVEELIRLANPSPGGRAAIALYEAVFLTNFLGAENPHGGGSWRRAAAIGADAALSIAEDYFGARGSTLRNISTHHGSKP